VTPAFVAWQLTRLGHGVVVPKTTSVDFRTTLPADRDFWSVYARGTYQNAPRFGNQQFGSMPGRYLFEVAPMLDTKTFPNGVYVITVTAGDERGNIGSLAQRISILNIGTTSGCPAPPPPPPPPPVTTTTGATTTTAPTTP
jgi:hypothetical protein